jgi:hypothetical protein
MDTTTPKVEPTPPHAPKQLPFTGRLLVWLFWIVFLAFGAFLVGDLIRGFWR